MSEPVGIRELIKRWAERRDDFARLGASVSGAAIVDEILADLNHIAANDSDDSDDKLSLTDAAAISGYSRDHLSRLIRDGTIPNAGRKGSPRIRRVDLPIRPKSPVAKRDGIAYDPLADARLSLGVRR